MYMRVLITGMGGLVLLAHHESARRELPGTELLPAELLARLDGIADAKLLRERCQSTSTLAKVVWSYDTEDIAPELGLPPGTQVLRGTGG